MTYQVRQALGASPTDAILDKAKQYLATIKQVGGQAISVLEDPYLPEMACRVAQLNAIEMKRPVPYCPATPGGKTGGIGLRKVAPVMRAYVYAEQHPIVKPVAVAAVIGVPFLLGYLVGRRR